MHKLGWIALTVVLGFGANSVAKDNADVAIAKEPKVIERMAKPGQDKASAATVQSEKSRDANNNKDDGLTGRVLIYLRRQVHLAGRIGSDLLANRYARRS